MSTNTEGNKLISGIISVLFGKFGGVLVASIITPILVRVLGNSAYGDYAFILSAFSIITIFARSGVSAGIRKYIAEERQDEVWEEKIFSFYTQLALVLCLIISGLLVLIAYYIPIEDMLGPNFPIYFIFMSMMIISDQFFYVPRFTLMGLHLERYSEFLSVLQKIMFGVIGISLAYVGNGITGVLTGTILSTVVCGIFALYILRNHINLRAIFRRPTLDLPVRDLLGYNAMNTVFVLLTVSLYHTDVILLQPLAGSEQTGLYKSALVVAEFLWFAPQAIQIVFVHSSSKLWSQGNTERITEIASDATRYTIIFTLLIAIGIASLAPEFITIYFGNEFSGAVIPLLLLLPGSFGFAVARPIYAIGQGNGDLSYLIIATGAAAIVNLGLNLLLIPIYGIAGAAVATSSGYGLMLLFHYFGARKIGYNPLSDIRPLRITTTALVSGMIIFVLADLISSSTFSLLVVPPIGFISYSFMCIWTGAVTTDEILPIISNAPDLISEPIEDILISIEKMNVMGLF